MYSLPINEFIVQNCSSCYTLYVFSEEKKSIFPSDMLIGGVYKASFVGRSDDKVVYKMADSGILASCPLEMMDGIY